MSTEINLSKRISAKEEGVVVTPNVNSLDFVGAGVNVTATGNDVKVTIPGSTGSTIYYLNQSINQAPYKEFSSVATAVAEQIVPATVAGGATTTIASFQTISGVPGTTVIPAGLWQMFLHFNAVTAGQNWIIRPFVYKRDLAGIETLILTLDPEIVTNMSTTTGMYACDAVLPTTSLLATDRLVVKIDMQNTTGVSQTVNFRTEGSQHYSVVANTLNQSVPVIATPTLDQVTTAGNSTANRITIGGFTSNGSVTAASLIARGNYINNTLVASANNDTLVGLDVAPAFTNGAFTGVSNIGLRVGGSTGLVYDMANGRLGIGTSTPTEKLHVIGDGRITGELINGAVGSNGTLTLRRSSDGATASVFQTFNNSTTISDRGGNGGYLTTSVGSTCIRWLGTNSTPRISVGFGDGNIDATLHVRGIGTTTTTSNFLVFNSALTELFRIRDNGNIGINTTTDAGFKVDINGTARVSGQFDVISGAANFRVNNTAAFVQLGIGSTAWVQYNSIETYFQSQQFFFTSGLNFRFNGVGQFGFTSNPSNSAQLQVDSTTRGFLPPRMTTTQKNAIASPAAGLELFDTTTLTPSIYNGTNWQNLLVPNSNGNVLINTTTDAGFKVDINGTARVQGNVTMTSGTSLTVGSIQIFDDISGSRVIQALSNQGLLIRAGVNTVALTNSIGTGNAVFSTTGVYNFLPNGATAGGGVNISAITTNPSSTTISFAKLRNDGTKSGRLITEDFAQSGVTPLNLFIYAGKETVLNNQANLILCHDGTTARGKLLVGTATAGASVFRMVGLPTSPTGLSSGDIWNNSGILNIV